MQKEEERREGRCRCIGRVHVLPSAQIKACTCKDNRARALVNDPQITFPRPLHPCC